MKLTEEQLLDHKKKLTQFHKQDVINRIKELKDNLYSTDYQTLKWTEKELTDEEYAPIKAQRQAWRDEINKLEGEIGL